jgi:GNAT superfamily N-acetyltransferase
MNAPAGVSFRVGVTEADLPALAEFRTRCNATDGSEDVYTVEILENERRHASGWGPAADEILAERDGAIAGWARVSLDLMATGEQVFEAIVRVDRDHRGNGIGRALLHRAEARITERARSEPHDGLRIAAGFVVDSPAATALYESEGYLAARHFFHMVREDLKGLEAPVLPTGIEVRPVGDDDIPTIFDAEEEAFQDDWMEAVPTEEDRRRYLGRPGVDPALWQVAWSGDEVAGIVFPAIDAEANTRYGRRRVLLDAVAIRRPFRRRGLATALMLRALHAARDAGMTSADLWVDSTNISGANRVYERLGFRVTLRATAYHKDLAALFDD